MLRRFTLCSLLLILLTATVVAWRHAVADPPTMEQKMGEAINCRAFQTYRHPVLGYVVRHPDFFEQMPDSVVNEWGACSFRYWNHNVRVEQSVYLLPNPGGRSARRCMDSLSRDLHAEHRECMGHGFVLSGPVFQNGVPLSGMRFYAKYVLSQRLIFVQQLLYPEGYDRPLTRLKRQVRAWQIWENHHP